MYERGFTAVSAGREEIHYRSNKICNTGITLYFFIFKFDDMETLVLHPENAAQLKAVKAFLKALKVPFESKPIVLPATVNQSIKRGLEQYESGQTITLQEFKAKHFTR